MTIEELLDELERLLMSAPRVVLTNRRVLEEDDFIVLLDQLRETIPAEIKEAQHVLSMQKQIIDDAHAEAEKIKQEAKYNADRMIDSANEYAAKATDEHEIIREAHKRAEVIVDKASNDAKVLRQDVNKYANDVFGYITGNLSNALQTVEQARATLNNESK